MYISYNWLKDFVKVPAGLTPEEMAERLTKHTVEIEGLINQSQQFHKVVVGKVLEINKHPNADRLRLTLVDVNSDKLKIVCGAPNIAVGQLVPVALMGAILPNGLEIKESEIRGEKSYGMVCAEDELGLGKDHEGIMVLDKRAKIGEPLAKYLKADDIVFEVDNKSLSNRPDLLSHYGLAREIAAIFKLNLKPYNKFLEKFEFLNSKENNLEVKVEDKESCPRYVAIKLENLSVKESPEWLKARLIAVNQKPINNIVDLTNYVMLETGQPLHAFDAEKIKKIMVRSAKKGESMETLDEKERPLITSDLVITDGHKPIALAGIMGGKNSGINEKTKTIILEAANFKAPAIRQTAQHLGLRTEASSRFEKWLDPQLTETAALRFLSLLRQLCPEMKIASSLIDIDNTVAKNLELVLDLAWLNNKIGQEIPAADVVEILEGLGFKVADKKSASLKITIPSWRATKDIATREDLAEEVLRMYGYDKIISKLPLETLSPPEINRERALERSIKNILTLKYNLTEEYSYSFLGEDQLNKLSLDFSNYLRLANPLSDIQTILRQSLAPGLINNIKNNQAKSTDLGFFEIGSVFFKAVGNLRKEAAGDDFLPYQEKHLGLVLAGEGADLLGRLKGLVSGLIKTIINREVETNYLKTEIVPGWADQKRSANIVVLGEIIGQVAMLNSQAIDNLNLKKIMAVAEINFTSLNELINKQPTFRFQEMPKYPTVVRDLAFVVDEKIMYNDLKEEIINFNPLLKSAEIFDVYVGNKLEDGKKSLAFHLTYRSDEKTLTAEEVDIIQGLLTKHLADKFSAQLRNF